MFHKFLTYNRKSQNGWYHNFPFLPIPEMNNDCSSVNSLGPTITTSFRASGWKVEC